MRVLTIAFFLFLVLVSCRESHRNIFSNDEVSELLSLFKESDNLKESGESKEVTLLFDQRLYDTYFIKLDNGNYFKLSYLGYIKYLHKEFFAADNEKTFFYDALNLKKAIPFEFVESSMKKNMIEGIVFSIDDQIFQEYKNDGIQALIDNYTTKGSDNFLIIFQNDEDLNKFYSVVFLFYINGYKYSFNEYSGFGIIQPGE